MNDEIRVSFGEIAGAQQNITGSQQQITQQLEDLRAFVAPLAATWTGDASERYQVQQREVDSAWHDLNSVLANIGVLVGQANDNYMATEQRIASQWGH